MDYNRPEATEEDIKAVATYGAKATNGKSVREIRNFILLILIENVRLTKEVNDHRAARGIAPLPTYR
jgi:ribosomal protein L31E